MVAVVPPARVATSQSPCPINTYMNASAGTTLCIPCPNGTFSIVANSTDPSTCIAGCPRGYMCYATEPFIQVCPAKHWCTNNVKTACQPPLGSNPGSWTQDNCTCAGQDAYCAVNLTITNETSTCAKGKYELCIPPPPPIVAHCHILDKGNQAFCYVDASTGTVYCLGDNTYGVLMVGTPSPSGPVAITMPPGRTAITVKMGTNACAQLDYLSIKCWGWNDDHACGIDKALSDCLAPTCSNKPIMYSHTPKFVKNGVAFAPYAYTLGSGHACGIDNADRTIVYCWGWNAHGQLGPSNSAATVDATLTFSPAVNIISSATFLGIAVTADNV
eukprot:915711-Rhodomonas_salina.2